MKRVMILAAAVVLLVGFATGPVWAAEATAALDINSAYVWRGLTFNDGAVLQPSVDVAAKNGLGFNVWGNYDIGDYNNTLNSNEFSEIDLTVSYSRTFGQLDAGVGVICYTFPAGGEETSELYLSLGMPIVAGLSTGLTIYYDIDALHAFSYANLSLAYSYDITDQLNIEASGAIGYAGEDFSQSYGGDDGGLYDYNLSLAVGYTISDAWSVSAKFSYIDALDDDNLKDVSKGGGLDTTTVYGVSVAYAF